MSRLLVICRQPEDLAAVRPTLPQAVGQGVCCVASDHSEVHATARALGAEAHFLERTTAFYVVADDVLQLLARINAYLSPLRPGSTDLPGYIWQWTHNIEGGRTNQILQDAVLLIRSFLSLLGQTRPDRVLLVHRADTVFDDCVIAACCRQQRLPLVSVHRHSPRTMLARASAALRPWLVAVYYIVAVLRERLRHQPPRHQPEPTGAVVFQVCATSSKHLENVRPLMQALHARGQPTLALCWAASDRWTAASATHVLARAGLAVRALECCLTLRDLWQSSVLALHTAAASRRPGARARLAELEYAGVPLGPLLRPALRHFLVAELPQRIRYFIALRKALAGLAPRALKPWGGPDLFEGQTAQALLARAHPKPLFFHYWIGASLPWPYAPGRSSLDLFLAKGAQEVSLARHDYGLAENQVEIVGQSRLTDYGKFIAATPVFESRQQLGLPVTARRFIGFDPNGVLRGYQSAWEQTSMVEILVQLAASYPDVQVVVKPHPSYSIAHLHPLLTAGHLPNVHVLPRNAPLDHFLNACDLILTKYSFLIIEAALCPRPSLAALLDGELRFKAFGDIAVVVTTPVELSDCLTRLATDDAFFKEWCAAAQERITRSLPLYLHRPGRPAAEVAADAIIARLPPLANLPGAN